MKNYDIKKIYEWPLMIQLFVGCILVLVVLYLGYLLDIVPLQSEIKAAQQQEDDLKGQFKISLDRQVSSQTDVLLLPKLQNLLALWEQRLITAPDMPALLDTILKYGQDNQLKFNLFDPGSEVKMGPYTMIPLRITLIGTYDQIGGFLSEVANMQRLVGIANFTIGKESDEFSAENPEPINSDLPLTADLTLDIYRK